jgi:hypothetical protein
VLPKLILIFHDCRKTLPGHCPGHAEYLTGRQDVEGFSSKRCRVAGSGLPVARSRLSSCRVVLHPALVSVAGPAGSTYQRINASAPGACLTTAHMYKHGCPFVAEGFVQIRGPHSCNSWSPFVQIRGPHSRFSMQMDKYGYGFAGKMIARSLESRGSRMMRPWPKKEPMRAYRGGRAIHASVWDGQTGGSFTEWVSISSVIRGR